MIGKLTGVISSIDSSIILLEVNGVGYEVHCSKQILSVLKIGNNLSLIIVTHMRENNIQLFGFNNNNEKNAFLLLQSVTGVGPKLALTILDYIIPENLEKTILFKEHKNFKIVPGVGSKLADRIILELSNKTICIHKTENDVSKSYYDANFEEAITALINLGLPRNEVINRLKSSTNNLDKYSTEDLIKLALQHK